MGDARRTTGTILEAAERIIIQFGVEKATIDEVAREAGVSKGGVLHHFPSKEAIVVALLSRLIEKFENDVNARQALDPEAEGSFARAFLNVAIERNDNCIEVAFALKAAFRRTPALQELVHKAHTGWQARIENDGLDPIRATVVRLATDGLWLARLNRAEVPSEQIRKPVIEYLISLTRTTSVPKQAASRTAPRGILKTKAL